MTFYYHANICSEYLHVMLRNNAFRDDFLNKKLIKYHTEVIENGD